MNKDTARDYLPLVQALAEGKTIQYRNDSNEWVDCEDPAFYQHASRYRIKPEPSQDNIEIAMALEDMANKIREMKVHCFDFETKAVQAGNGLVYKSTFTWQNMNQQVATGGAYANDPKISGWIEWNGGDCPVSYHEIVSVKCRDGSICNDWQAVNLRWEYAGKNAMLNPAYDIIAYRIVK